MRMTMTLFCVMKAKVNQMMSVISTVTIQKGTSSRNGRRVGHWFTSDMLISFSEQELLIEV